MSSSFLLLILQSVFKFICFCFELMFVGPIEFAQSLEDVLIEARERHLTSKEAKQTLLANLPSLVTGLSLLIADGLMCSHCKYRMPLTPQDSFTGCSTRPQK